ncbi:DsbA family protein [Streptomyces sp. SAJ15]|uniref:DsbA family protein n=1 Tax=Streptomyces sp. SAJ15 TaxID=2011095 RepID=UPI001186D819|nr:DsbA family protein [Streptomyces sp. SAJ15]TVL89221.1 disulfide bond formation protein DsbA [Streptomyces sp. SAJ15]
MPARTTTRRLAAIGAVVALIVSLVATALAFTQDDDSAPAADAPAGQRTTDPERQRLYDQLAKATSRREGGDKLALGRHDAPVVLVEYADYQCSYCGRFTRETQPKLIEKYVDRGVLRIEFRNFTVFGADSERAARASWAAAQQGRFRPFHDTLFAKLRKGDALAEDKLIDLAEESGVRDLDRFAEDMEGSDAKAALKRDAEEGYRIGVQSTPSFLINGRPVAGAQPTEVFEQVIDEALAATKASGGAERPAGPKADGK